MPVDINITVDDKPVILRLNRMIRRLENATPAFEIIGETVVASIDRNFEEGGRPNQWEPLSQVTILDRQRENKWPGKILIRRGKAGGLQGSVSFGAQRDRVIISANKVYAAVQHFGIGVRSSLATRRRSPAIPARPFMMVQPEDWTSINRQFLRYLYG